MNKFIKSLLLILVISTYITCSDEDTVVSTEVIENPKVIDVANTNSASDLIVLFRVKENNLNLTGARIGLVQSTKFSAFTADKARSLPPSSYTEISGIAPNKLLEVRLSQSLQDVDGEKISQTTNYKVVFMLLSNNQVLLDKNTITATLGVTHFLDGKYTGTWNDNRYSNFPVSATLGVNGSSLKGAFYYSGNFTPCCGGSNDGQITINVAEDGITLSDFRYDQFLDSFQGGNCVGTYTGDSKLNSYTNIEITFEGNDCEGDHTGGKMVLTKQ